MLVLTNESKHSELYVGVVELGTRELGHEDGLKIKVVEVGERELMRAHKLVCVVGMEDEF